MELWIKGVVPYSTVLSVFPEVSQQTHIEVGEGSCRYGPASMPLPRKWAAEARSRSPKRRVRREDTLQMRMEAMGGLQGT